MKTIDAMRTHISNLRCQGLMQVAMVDVEKCLDEIERELEEEYVPLPKDADGVTIHIGDRVENNERVVRITLTDGSWEPSVYVDKAPCVIEEYFCCAVSHYHKPTVEDVLEKALNEAAMLDRKEGYWPSAADITNIVNELAPKLLLKETDNELN